MLEEEEEIIDAPIIRGTNEAILDMVKWWEKKRLYYNLVVVGISVFTIWGLWSKAFVAGGPQSVILTLITHIVGANLFYCSGWGIGILRFYYFKGEHMPNQARWLLFIAGTGVSFIYSWLYFVMLFDGFF